MDTTEEVVMEANTQPLPEPAPREHVQTRAIKCKGYRRQDGLWDIEGHLQDTRTYPYQSRERGMRQPGSPVHDMWIRLTLDDRLEVKQVACSMMATPLATCSQIVPVHQGLVGLHIGPGWNKAVRNLLGGARGCTHLVELLGPVGSTAIQTIYGYLADYGGNERPREKTVVASCHAIARQVDPDASA